MPARASSTPTRAPTFSASTACSRIWTTPTGCWRTFARDTAAAASNILSIIGVVPELDDPDGLLADVRQARRLGFTSKSTFNPRQIDVINEVFSPQPDEIAYARKIAAGFREAEARGDASVAVGGQLVDRPIVLRALRML